MNNGGTIDVNLSEKNNSYVVGIRDTGDGINQDTINKIFNPFFTTRQEGTGLGLAITHRIIQSHKGRIEVESKTGQGTVFTVFLPCVRKEEGL